MLVTYLLAQSKHLNLQRRRRSPIPAQGIALGNRKIDVER
jgi:hypothetical protein